MNLIMTPTMEGKVTDNNFYTYDIKGIHMIKAVASKLSKIGLTQNKELVICLAIDYMASTNIASFFRLFNQIQSHSQSNVGKQT